MLELSDTPGMPLIDTLWSKDIGKDFKCAAHFTSFFTNKKEIKFTFISLVCILGSESIGGFENYKGLHNLTL